MKKPEDSFQAEIDQHMKHSIKELPNPSKERVVTTTLIGGQFHPAISKQLGIMAIEEEKTKRELLEEALDLLFVKRNKPRIDDLVT